MIEVLLPVAENVWKSYFTEPQNGDHQLSPVVRALNVHGTPIRRDVDIMVRYGDSSYIWVSYEAVNNVASR